MSLTKHGLYIDCDHCKFNTGGKNKDFVVIVPIRDESESSLGFATLKCVVKPDRHNIDLIQLVDSTGSKIRFSASAQQRLKKALDFIGKRKICGNQNICPSNVIDFVEKNSSH